MGSILIHGHGNHPPPPPPFPSPSRRAGRVRSTEAEAGGRRDIMMASLLSRSPKPPLSSPWTRRWRRRAVRNSASSADEEAVHDAIVVGGGPVGLLLSNLLSNHSVRHVLLDGRPVKDLLRHPQAHFINVRSMEILRAEVPRVYGSVLRETPDVGEWESFNFGGSVLEERDFDGLGGRRLGRVVHPVRRPLRAGQRGDAVPVPTSGSETTMHEAATDIAASSQEVSTCRPAHLAQNHFVSLLLQEARRHSFSDDRDATTHEGKGTGDHLRYGEEVVGISQHMSKQSTRPITTIQTSLGNSYRTRYLLAADGAHSFVRRHFDIPMSGEPSIQSLINVHFRTNEKLSELLMRRHRDRAMLHFVYNPRLVGAFVCHDGKRGEWVLQVPFFPPFQAAEDFDETRVRDIIWSGLVGTARPHDDNLDCNNHLGFEILSVRPWTMSSLVAQRYLDKSKTVALLGDAAHSFPPAGGFGMNTGLQDAHNVAWRLALLLHREKRNRSKDGPKTSAPTPKSFSDASMSEYDQERRPVATSNAALSVRNYQRTLDIARACYLDAQHPRLLISTLGAPPANLLPLETRRDMFWRLVGVAMAPLGSLVSPRNSGGSSFHADRVERNVRSILERGGSLPLVFPRFELGFSYTAGRSATVRETAEAKSDNDTAGYFPRLKVGHRMPHIPVEVLVSTGEGWDALETLGSIRQTTSVNNFADDDSDSNKHISLTDISSQLRRAYSYSFPLFTLLAFGPALTSSANVIGEAAICVVEKWKIPLVLVNVLHAGAKINELENNFSSADTRDAGELDRIIVLQALDTQRSLLELLHKEKRSVGDIKTQTLQKQTDGETRESADDLVNALIMVRPDGHIANTTWIGNEIEGKEASMSKEVRQAIEQGYQNALGVVMDV